MAEFAGPDDPTQLYVAIEKAYCEDRWADVLSQGQALLSQLPEEDRGLRQRLELLMAHTFLYGYGDRDSAEDLYRSVLGSRAEASLRLIAEQGLQQCDLPPQRPPLAATGPDTAAAAEPEVGRTVDPEQLPRPVAGASLEEATSPSLHESIEALGGSQLQPPTDGDDLPAAIADPAPSPAMPWLEAAAAAGGVVAAGAAVASGGGAMPEWAATDEEEAMGRLAVEAEDAGMPPLMGVDVTEPLSEPTLESLIPEVIDEPELIEVHQADPLLAEELELSESLGYRSEKQVGDEGIGALASPPEPVGAEEEDPELLQGLLKVTIR